MLCGTIPISAKNHDVDRFIVQGVNGFYGDSEGELSDYVRFVCRAERERRKLSVQARRTALDMFNHDRFLLEWGTLIKEVV